ncbi:uncharacterized protein LOC126755806 [Bactrocera neohumeralis]|uniref:uncharacterized protein LOC126755806 n=1 Tax=Bactrocera neohumeralis TaxID=98809 RepID=UPI0021667223|nr:uncharacterized protein LOC126755806 [Bactrocera neohumeralis]
MASLNLRTSAHAAIVRIGKMTEAANYDPDSMECDVIRAQLDKHFERFMEYHTDLVSSAQSSELTTHDDFLAATELLYTQICIRLRRICGAGEGGICVANQLDMRLDPIKIPVFNGDPANWLPFKDLFEALVHNRKDLNSSYKLSKLRQHVNADSVPLVGGLYTGGYEDMWQEMKRRFDNPRLLVESHVQRILNLPNQPTESQKGLLRLVDTVQNVMRALSVMGLPVNHWDALLVPLLLPKLPTITRYEWGMSLQTNNIPMSQDFLTFIEKRANNLPQGATNSTSTLHQRPTRPVKANVATVNSSQPLHSVKGITVFCQLCANGHRIHKCQRFVNLSIPERWDTVKRLSLCFNCLGSDHGSRDCTSRDCLRCHHRHHTMLCKSNVANNSPATEEDTNSHIIDRNISVDTPSTQVPQVYPRQQ